MADIGATIGGAAAVAKTLESTGLATGLSSVTNAATSVSSAISSFTKLGNVKLPIPNPLFSYASYDYVLGLGILTDEQFNNPDTGYIAPSAKIALICKDASADPNNRINTVYGKFDFYIDNLVINAFVGTGPNINSITFDIVEPYSMGMFFLTCQTAAFQNGHLNWKDAPYLLTIEFRGCTETGSMVNVPNTTRKIPIKFQDISMRVTEKGSVYTCSAFAANSAAYTDEYKKVKTDMSIEGRTVQEVLQTGEKSLQAVLNKRYQDLAKKGIITVPDEILILFPQNPASGATSAATASAGATGQAKTATTGDTPLAADLIAKLGVTRNTKTQLLEQNTDNCNEIGKAPLGFDKNRPADTPIGKDDLIYNKELKIYVRRNNTQDVTLANFKFSQDTDVVNVINQVMLQSGFIDKTLDANSIKAADGFRTWWRIDTQVYNISTKENYTSTGVKPKLVVYRILPADVHVSKAMSPNVKPPGLVKLDSQIVKAYNYIYTGKNVDIINFDIQYNAGFATVMAANSYRAAGDVKLAGQTGDAKGKETNERGLAPGNAPELKPGTDTTRVKYTSTVTDSDRKGGGGPDTQNTRIAKMFHDAIHSMTNLVNINMTIIGDPYYITQSGSGNYTAQPTQYSNLNSDYTVNYQNGDVHIKINFRTPIDINQTTGMYNFSGQTKTTPVLMFSGFYKLTNIESRFSSGKFTQVLTGNRVDGQELSKEATKDQLLNVSTPGKVVDTRGGTAGVDEM